MKNNSHDTASTSITRRDLIKLAGSAALTGAMWSFVPGMASAITRGERLNIIFILADNMRWDCAGFKGHPFIKTPGIDRLAAEGVVFDNAFNTTSLCSPSRASILTGTYAHTHGVLNNHTPWTGKRKIFFDHLKLAGYDNAFIGKWHMPGHGLPKIPSLDLFASYTHREGQGSYFNCPFIVNGKQESPSKKYITEETTDRAIAFMEQRHNGSGGQTRPFCLYISHRPSHPPYRVPRDIAGMYDQSVVSLPDEVDSWFSRTNGNVFQGIMMGSYDNQYRKYCETITAMDRDILRLLDWLDQSGLNDNTVVIFMSDNGNMWGEHRCQGIKFPYEESIRVPLIVRDPRVVRLGQRKPQMVLNIDIGPTILDMAGITVPPEMEGRSMLPILESRNVRGRKAWMLEYWKYFPENFPTYVGVRTETHKYIEYEKTLTPEIFDLKNDRGEKHNLYGTQEGDRVLPELKKMLTDLKSGKRLD
jgi:N-acetylglucosamine-6-sulfatase